jgi:hypothetical protein
VNRAGSVPPVAADIAAGATIESTGTQLYIDNPTNQYWSGITFKATGAGASCNYFFGSGGAKTHYLTNCLLWVNNTTASSGFRCNGSIAKIVLDNTTVRFGAVGQQLFYPANGYPTDVTWQNSPTPIHASGSVPTALFAGFGGAPLLFTLRGVDLSLLTTTLFVASANASVFNKVLLDSCRIAAGLTRYTSPGAAGTSSDEVELVNCFDGTNILSERHTPAGDVNTDKSTTMVGGAQDDVGLYSTKLVSSSRSDPFAMTLDSFWMDVELTTTGAPRTATVEIISSASLNNTDINLMLEYQGTAGSSLGTFAYSLPSPLTPSAAVPTSTVTWNNQPTTPVKQHLQVTFTPQVAGRVRGIVRLGKVSTTVWINPQVIIT